MALNPFRAVSSRSGLDACSHDTPFQAEAAAALASFRIVHDELRKRVRQGELTPKVARERAAAAAAGLRERLLTRADGYSPVPRAFLDRLVEVSEARQKARERQTLESLQRETNRLLRLGLIEQQIVHRAAEFEARSFRRPLAGGQPAPTLEGLLAFHEAATQAGDDAAREWARRQLERLRPSTSDPDDQRRIDEACDRPDQVNPRTVIRYLEALRDRSADERERFVAEAIAASDASACAAAFALAREAPEGAALRWVRAVLDGLKSFPDAALTALRTW
ncbi:MAG: hypothetical protein IRY99_26100, partial [Isosphaeraceae bacterium]|nr:hypothetical protein [Isosphaeraceae bacterium]